MKIMMTVVTNTKPVSIIKTAKMGAKCVAVDLNSQIFYAISFQF